MITSYNIFNKSFEELSDGKVWVNTINAHSYNLSRRDPQFSQALRSCDVLLPDGVSIIWAKKFIERKNIRKQAGNDFFNFSMNRLQHKGGGKVFFLGSSINTLEKIKDKACVEYPDVTIYTYSPPFKKEFSTEDNRAMISAINKVKPDVLFVGMTAPKQEKWVYENIDRIEAGHIGCIGAVFDFFAETKKRAPQWMINLGLEWFFRLILEPRRLTKRYLVGNTLFVLRVLREKFSKSKGIPKKFKNKIIQQKGFFLSKRRMLNTEERTRELQSAY